MTYQLNHIDPDEIDRLRFKAFKTNDPYDTLTYYKAASAYFQDRHVREMIRADLATQLQKKKADRDGYDQFWAALEPATPLDDPRVKALVDATKNLTDIAHKHTFGKTGILDVHAAVKNTRAALSALEENK